MSCEGILRDGPWIVTSERFSAKYDPMVPRVEGSQACVQEQAVPVAEPSGMESTFQASEVESITSRHPFVDMEAVGTDVPLPNVS